MTEADETLIRRLRLVAYSVHLREPALANDLESAIRFKQSSPEKRELARGRDPTLIRRLEERAKRAIEENQSPLANDLQAAVEMIRGL